MGNNPLKIFFFATLLGIIFVVFRSFFSLNILTAPDLPFVATEKIKEFVVLPSAWDTNRMGEYKVPFLFAYPSLLLLGAVGSLSSFALAERIVWFYPFILLSTCSIGYLSKLFTRSYLFFSLSLLFFLLNTYILMVVGGGQMGLALAYALSPLVLGIYISLIETLQDTSVKGTRKTVMKSLTLGLLLTAQVFFDPRIVYVTLIAVGIYCVISQMKFWLNNIYSAKQKITFFSASLLFGTVLPGMIIMGLHAYWILPTVLQRGSTLPEGYGSEKWLDFLSFASFSNSFSLLHPNWPENIFGKTYFMRPEFLIIPILAYSSLLFNKKDKTMPVPSKVEGKQLSNVTIPFFILLGLLGAFLAKGSKPPLGEINVWLFKNIPGMNLFRDPTKFYVLVALSYSVLVPFSIYQIYDGFRSKIKNQFSQENSLKANKSKLQFKIKKYLPSIFLLLVTSYLLLLIRPAWLGELSGTFKASTVPTEYIKIKDFIHTQPQFFRTFWLPAKQRFVFYENNHPAIFANEYFNTSDEKIMINLLKKKNKDEELRKLGIKYIIIPYDSEGEIFLTERKYDPKKREKFVAEIEKLDWLEKKKQFSQIVVFELKNPRDHFWVEAQGKIFSYKMVNPTKYEIEGETKEVNSQLIFSESFHPLWNLKIDEKTIFTERKYQQLNSFRISKEGKWRGTIEFTPQKYVKSGLVISGITVLMVLLYFARAIVLKLL